LFDTIQAEERLTNAATSVVSAKASLAEEIAKLRFETATLISKDVAYRIPGFPKPVESLQISRNSFTMLPVQPSVNPDLTSRFCWPAASSMT
jgi:hypothetical protein